MPEAPSAPTAPKPAAAPAPRTEARSPRPDAIRSRVDNDPGVIAAINSGKTAEVADRKQMAYGGILKSTKAEIDNDPGVTAAINSGPGEIAHQRGIASTRIWGKFAEQNPTAAEMFSAQDPEVKNAIELYRNQQITEARRLVEGKINSLVNTDSGVAAAINSPTEIADRRQIAESRATTQAWNEYVKLNPDTARFLADSGIDKSITDAYANFETQQEANKVTLAQQAAETAKSAGADAGLAVIAAEPKAPPPEASPPPVATIPKVEQVTPQIFDADGNPVFWNDKALGVAPQQNATRAESPEAAKARTKAEKAAAKVARKAAAAETPAPPTPEVNRNAVPDRIVEAVSYKLDTERAADAARKRGAPPEEIAALDKAAKAANTEYASALADRDAAVIDSRLIDLQESLREVQGKLSANSTPNGEAIKPETKDEQLASLTRDMQAMKDAIRKLAGLQSVTDPKKRQSLLASVLAAFGAAVTGGGSEAIGSVQVGAAPRGASRPN